MGSLPSTLYNPTGSNYTQLKRLGSGSFGVVLKCINEDTREIVAVKIQNADRNFKNEYNMLNFLMTKNLDEKNIVKFIEMFPLENNKSALVFELMDRTLSDHIKMTHIFTSTLLDLASIRSIIHQMAIALDALKTNKVIHSDIKTNNIMVLDREEQPLKVRLIDFGLAIPTRLAKQGSRVQVPPCRAPEIILGLPFSESIDMWSLGVVMGYMLTGYVFFPSDVEHTVLQYMVELLGALPDNIDGGMFTKVYCKKTPSGQWRLKTPEECFGRGAAAVDRRRYRFRNLDQLERLTHLANEDNDEKKASIDLLKAMLQMDPSKRITPSQVLAHPFITRGNFQQSSNLSSSGSDLNEQTPLLNQVKPAPPKHCLKLEENSEDEFVELEKRAPLSPYSSEDSDTKENPSRSRSGLNKQTPQTPLLIQVKPAPPKRCLKLEEDSEEELVELEMRPHLPRYFSEDSDTEEKPSSSRSGLKKQTPQTPLLIQVKPVPPERCLKLEEDTEEELVELETRPRLPLYFSKDSDTEEKISEDSDTEEKTSEDRTVSSGDPAPDEKTQKEEKKKRKKKGGSCLVRFGRWLRKKLCRCTATVHATD
ncbi:homeodomain-interacting protein kinase 2-like [Xyrichtys novacula]|uniref:Homeodomain-interacting protein kinase 2-like n=1 Tax=Xyrichtys novacula TaxID=13765 RepID=A0AAV1EKY5_XYRNO|nr:homeodomain-interacting protein kinase 2-like [Xyrichtys novacula]